MKSKLQVASCKLQVFRKRATGKTLDLRPSTFNHRRAFTLLELLVVISILGILAGLTVPALKNLGKSNSQVGATRQMLDDVGRARQLAISQRTTVYMVFVPTNFFNLNNVNGQNMVAGLNAITPAADNMAAMTALTNVVDKQLTGYNFISYGKVGDQPGQHYWHYLDDWHSLPDGSFVAAAKFQPQNSYTAIPQWQKDYAGQLDTAWTAKGGYQVNQLSGFALAQVPFPTEQSPLVWLPCIAFDYLGRLVSEVDINGNFHHAYIPLAEGTVSYGMDINKVPQLTPVLPQNIAENPPGNSTSISYNVIDINPLTGRAELQKFKLK